MAASATTRIMNRAENSLDHQPSGNQGWPSSESEG